MRLLVVAERGRRDVARHRHGLLTGRDAARRAVRASVARVARMLSVVAHRGGVMVPVDHAAAPAAAAARVHVMVAVIVLDLMVGHVIVTGRCRDVTALVVLLTRRELGVDHVRGRGIHEERAHGDHLVRHCVAARVPNTEKKPTVHLCVVR